MCHGRGIWDENRIGGKKCIDGFDGMVLRKYWDSFSYFVLLKICNIIT